MKRVLIISYYWPPSGGPGVQRWLKFVKYLPEYNIEPILFVPKNANYPLIDNSLADQVDTGLKVISHPITEISKFLPKFEFLKSARTGNISIPANQSFFQKVFFGLFVYLTVLTLQRVLKINVFYFLHLYQKIYVLI